MPIRTPGDYGGHYRMRQHLEKPPTLYVPEPDGGLVSCAGEYASIRGKRHTVHPAHIRIPARRPKQITTCDIPHLDLAIPTSPGQGTPIGAERENPHKVIVGMPDSMQSMAACFPHSNVSLPTTGSPVCAVT